MIDYPVFFGLWGVLFIFIALNRSSVINSAERVLIDSDSTVFCRDLPLTRIFKLSGKALNKSDIIKIQQGPRSVSLVSANGEKLDMILPKSTVAAVAARAQKLFPNATVSQI